MRVPIAIVLAALTALGSSASGNDSAGLVAVGGLLFLPPLLMIVFRGKYPRWWFDWNVELMRFTNRVYAYGTLLSDRYPSTDEQQYVKLELEYPDARKDLSRWMPLVKWFLAIPHYVVLAVLSIGARFAVVAAWFSILFTGRYPRASSTTSWESCAGTTASARTRSCSRPTSTRPSGYRTNPVRPPRGVPAGRAAATDRRSSLARVCFRLGLFHNPW